LRATPASTRPALVSAMPSAARRRAPQRSAAGPVTMPRPKYRKPANENTSDTEPRDAENSRSSDSRNALNVYAAPNPRNVIANAATTTNQPRNTRGEDEAVRTPSRRTTARER